MHILTRGSPEGNKLEGSTGVKSCFMLIFTLARNISRFDARLIQTDSANVSFHMTGCQTFNQVYPITLDILLTFYVMHKLPILKHLIDPLLEHTRLLL